MGGQTDSQGGSQVQAQVHKLQKVVNFNRIQLTCDQLVSTCVWWPNGGKLASTCDNASGWSNETQVGHKSNTCLALTCESIWPGLYGLDCDQLNASFIVVSERTIDNKWWGAIVEFYLVTGIHCSLPWISKWPNRQTKKNKQTDSAAAYVIWDVTWSCDTDKKKHTHTEPNLRLWPPPYSWAEW